MLLFSFESYAQNNRKEKLQKQQTELEKEIKLVNSLIEENKKASKFSTVQVRNINKKINIRRNIIRNINQEIKLINTDITDKQTLLSNLKKDVDALKVEYAKIIIQSYKSRSSNDKLMYLLSSENFNQARKRLKYIDQYSDYRKDQVNKIKENQTKVAIIIENLLVEKNNKAILISDKQLERKNLVVEKNQREIILKELGSKNKELISEIQLKHKKSEALQNEIHTIILAEIKKAEEKARKEKERLERIARVAEEKRIAKAKADAKKNNTTVVVNKTKKTKSKKTYVLTADAKKLAVNFKSNKNKLPWPVERGTVVSRYGKHPHPTIKRITIVNHGVDIATTSGASARAVFEGKVSTVILSKSGGSKTVIVQHGNYYTVYSNLNKIYVKKGEKVKIKQKIGLISTNALSGDTVLKFQLWYNKQEQNPAYWLYKM